VIEQDVFLFSRPVAANIAFGREDASPSEIEAAARAAQAHGFVSALPKGYDEVVGERGTTLSGGQKQRVAIARALLADPRVLLLDDATSAIDAATEDEIRAAMDGARKGRTTFLVTHRLAQIRRADRILVLDRGELVAQGRHEELYETVPAYRRLFERTA
ncbi:MAG TPA: ATP-binding cassette domain-containing protein, partial [Spirochaetales bacterium]|nr:ATP-binding cassette domain-containing protein [Spirochaetales bacterium]